MPSSNVAFASVPAFPPETDPVPADLRAVIDLFTSHLAKVTFPDVDAATLRRHADELRAEAKTVARAREALAAALVTSDARLAVLTDAAARAVAYARIYSEAAPDRRPIADALTALVTPAALDASAPTKTGKRRGRPPKQSAELFDAQTSAADLGAP